MAALRKCWWYSPPSHTRATGIREYNVHMAATILTAAVPLAVYFISGKWFVRGIAAGAVKG